MENNEMTILKGEALEAQTRAEVDISISTAKKYPRDIRRAIGDIEAIATQDKDIAASCFFSLPRGGKTITGESIRLAEIVVSCWGNINAGYRIIANDGKQITAQAIVHDLEKNVRLSAEVSRRITKKDGTTFDSDMQIVTGNAAGSIAYRNAVFKVIPKAIMAGLLDKIKDVVIGKSLDIETRRGKAVDHFKKLGVTEKELFATLGVASIEDIGRDELLTLIGLTTALKEGETTIDETFRAKKSVNGQSITPDVLKSILPPDEGSEIVTGATTITNADSESLSPNTSFTAMMDEEHDKQVSKVKKPKKQQETTNDAPDQSVIDMINNNSTGELPLK